MAKPSITIPTSATMLVLLLIMTFALAFSTTRGGEMAGVAALGARPEATVDFYLPVAPVEHRPAAGAVSDHGSWPMGTPFQTCMQCRCCLSGDATKCAMMQCCYGIICGLPGKPPEVCTFVPKACNCSSCR